MNGRRPEDRPESWLVRWSVSPLSDPRDRAEVLADFEELRRKGRHGRLWYWRELIAYGWSLRRSFSSAAEPVKSRTPVAPVSAAWSDSIRGDLRYATRTLVKDPGLALVAVPTIALAIGATTALFSFADALVLRPLPVREPDRLVALFHVSTQGSQSYSSFSHPDYVELRDWNRIAEDVAAYASTEVRLGDSPDTEPVEAMIVSANYFDVLGAAAVVGRTFLPEEDRTEGTHPVVVLGEGLLQRRFGGDRSVVGRAVTLNGRPFTVVGVMPAGTPSLDLGTRPELWVPLMMHETVLPGFHPFGIALFHNRGTHWLDLIARLPAGADRRALQAEVGQLAGRQAHENPETNRGWSIAVVPAAAARLGPPGASPLVPLTGLVGAVVAMILLIACANVANLLLARASARVQEMAVRASLGASRARLLAQTLTESLLIAFVGGGLGVVLALWSMRLLPVLDLTLGLVGLDLRLDRRVLAFAIVVTVGTGLLFGLAPALRASAAGACRPAGRFSGRGAAPPAMRRSLVVAQVALTVVLLIGSGLTLRTLSKLAHVPLGFDVGNLLLAPIDLTQTGGSALEDLRRFEGITDRVRGIPGVRGASLARISPFSGSRMANDIFFETGDSAGERGRTNVDMNVVDADYFRVLGIPLLAGRTFTVEDRSGSPDVVVVNQALAERLWPGGSAVGRLVWDWHPDGSDRAMQVVGVVGNGRYYRSWRTADRPFLFKPLAQDPSREMVLHVRVASPSHELRDSVRQAVLEADAAVPTPLVRSAAEAMAASVAVQRTNARLLALFGALALIVAMIGVYGVVSFTVSQRMHEIGVRMALGARAPQVRGLILIGSARPILVGGLLGVVAAAALTRFLAPVLFGVGPHDPITFVTVPVLLLAVGLVATALAARRGTRVDPLIVLRE